LCAIPECRFWYPVFWSAVPAGAIRGRWWHEDAGQEVDGAAYQEAGAGGPGKGGDTEQGSPPEGGVEGDAVEGESLAPLEWRAEVGDCCAGGGTVEGTRHAVEEVEGRQQDGQLAREGETEQGQGAGPDTDELDGPPAPPVGECPAPDAEDDAGHGRGSQHEAEHAQ